MKPLEIIVIICASLLVLFTIIYNIYRKVKGKSSCCYNPVNKADNTCGNCSSCIYGDCCTKNDKNKTNE